MIELGQSLGLEVRFSISLQELAGLALSHAGCLVILDLASTEYDPGTVARTLKQNKTPPQILGYYPHIRRDLEANAKSAGVDYVVPNSNFLKRTKEILEEKIITR